MRANPLLLFVCSGANATNARSIAVELNGQDNFVSNVIVFDYAKMGVLVNGAASILTGVHTWNGGGVGTLDLGFILTI